MIDHYDRAAGLEAVIDRAAVPLPDFLADDRRGGLLHVGVEVIEHDVVSAAAHHAALDADRIIGTSLLGVPLAGRLTVC